MNFIRNLSFIQAILILLFSFVSASASDVDNYRKVTCNKAGFYLQAPQAGECSSPYYISTNLVGIDVRMKSGDEYSSFKDALKETEEFYAHLAKTVKENQFYRLMKSETFETKSGLKGVRSIYGYTLENPNAISYFFKNNKEDFIQIRFLTGGFWKTGKTWKDVDKILMNGLGLIGEVKSVPDTNITNGTYIFSDIESDYQVTDLNHYDCKKIDRSVIEHILKKGSPVTQRDVHDYYSTSGCSVKGNLKINGLETEFEFDYGGIIYFKSGLILGCGKACCNDNYPYCSYDPEGLK